MKLLLVEDSIQLNKALATVLKRNSYIVDSAFDGEEALLYIEQYHYDVIILDIMLPKINGLDVLKRVRINKIDTPIIMLTAKSTTEDKIHGLDLGADDYLPKPFVVDELLARIRALLRRQPSYEEDNKLSFGDLVLDTNNCCLINNENKVTLMNKELQIMTLLMKANGNVVSQDTISKNVWDIDSYSTSENVWVFISYLRKKLDSINSKVKIKSIRYQGYYLEYNND
ncbi:MAG: response regulator transcription factor [Bacilli bacterium]|nr:response regulator transcription factor [Bacilli bacterium]